MNRELPLVRIVEQHEVERLFISKYLPSLNTRWNPSSTSYLPKNLPKKPRTQAKEKNLVGKRVFVTAGRYRQSGEGIVECDRGYGTLRTLEVRPPNGRIQFCSLKDARFSD